MNIAVVGATGQVGKVMRTLLWERNFPVGDIRFMASSRSAGSSLNWGDEEIVVECWCAGGAKHTCVRAEYTLVCGPNTLACGSNTLVCGPNTLARELEMICR